MNNDNLYTIKKGDTFRSLEKECGIPSGTLERLNPGVNPKKLQIGQRIKMPTLIYLIVTPNYDSSQINLNRYDNMESRKNEYNKNKEKHPIKSGIDWASYADGSIGLVDTIRTNKLSSNELWHIQKNGTITHRWKTTKSGASHWNHNTVIRHRAVFVNASQTRAISPSWLKYAGAALLAADIVLSGDLKPSHAVNAAAMVFASLTGVGSIIVGVFFVADIGTGLIIGETLSDKLDKAAENFFGEGKGKIKFYEGLY